MNLKGCYKFVLCLCVSWPDGGIVSGESSGGGESIKLKPKNAKSKLKN